MNERKAGFTVSYSKLSSLLLSILFCNYEEIPKV